jgi:plastocyanin
MTRLALIAIVAASVSCHHGPAATVTIRGMKFEPAIVTIEAGESVRFDNQDIVPHTATAKGVFDSGAIAAHDEWSVLLAHPGTYAYGCTLHPVMTGQIIVR